MPIKNNNNLLNTIDSHIKLRKLKEKYLKVCKADALKQVNANVREEGNKNYSSLYYSNKSEAQLRKASKEEELAKTKKEKREKEAQERKARLDSLLDSNNYCLDSSLDINSKNNLENKEATIAKDLKNEIVAIDPVNSILCDLSDLLIIRFCIFSNSALENIGILINKKVVEMQTNTATALANKLAAVNKLFALVRSFRKVDRHVFRANNTISGRTIFNKFYNCKLESTIIAKFYKDL
ncbi:hypothetical protein HBI21_243320 [Parastagonospora nodorum]|nr:hypothetical protein HBI21_243320 [Parastagonospora nodorum]